MYCIASFFQRSIREVIDDGDIPGLLSNLEEEDPGDIDQPRNDLGGKTILYEATRLGKADLVRLLLERGADPSVIVKKTGKSPFLLASKDGNPEVFMPILSSVDGNSFTAVNCQDTKQKKSPLHLMTETLLREPEKEQQMKHCLKAFFDTCSQTIEPNLQDINGDSPIVFAIITGSAWLA